MSIKHAESKQLFNAIFFPVIISILVILLFVFEQNMGFDFSKGGVYPRDPKTLLHIFSMPFVHSGWGHLMNNIVSFFLLSVCLYFFYKDIANQILFISYVFCGLLLWVIGRDSWHIGLSGIVYSLSFFLFFSGLIRKHIPLIAISFIVVFLYGNNVWYLFPWQKLNPISWEGHLSGAIIGCILAFVYKNKGPQKPEPIWDDEDENDDDDENAIWRLENTEINEN